MAAEFFKNFYQNSIGKAAESSVHILVTGVNKRTKLVHFLLQKIRRPINFNLFYENIISNTIPVWTCFFSKITSMNVTSPCTLPVKMFGPFWSVWYKIALAEVGVSLP